jgi:hypothetical protein
MLLRHGATSIDPERLERRVTMSDDPKAGQPETERNEMPDDLAPSEEDQASVTGGYVGPNLGKKGMGRKIGPMRPAGPMQGPPGHPGPP